MNKLKQQRLNCGMSQSELAENAHVHIQTVKKYESDNNIMRDSLSTLLRLSVALKCPMDAIVEDERTLKLLDTYMELYDTNKLAG